MSNVPKFSVMLLIVTLLLPQFGNAITSRVDIKNASSTGDGGSYDSFKPATKIYKLQRPILCLLAQSNDDQKEKEAYMRRLQRRCEKGEKGACEALKAFIEGMNKFYNRKQ